MSAIGAFGSARLVGRDHTTDIAVLRVDRSDLPPIPLETQAAPVGALALAVGAEDGAPTAALGVVSHSIGPWWSLRGGEINAGPQPISPLSTSSIYAAGKRQWN